MSIVEEIYKKNYKISDLELAEEILTHKELTIEDLWLLPQYPFNEWRRKYDYPNILANIKSNQSDFIEWMGSQGLTDEDMISGYLSDFFASKPFFEVKAKVKIKRPSRIKEWLNEKPIVEDKPYDDIKKKHLMKTTYKGEVSFQVWHNYDGKTSEDGDGEPVIHEYIKSFISYYDWIISKGGKFNFINKFHRDSPNTPDEQVYLNHNIKLLKMGGIHPPTNGIGILLRGKRLEFINVTGLELHGTIYFGTMGNLSFSHCSVDNLKCNELFMPNLDFENCSINNIQVRNSNIQQWDFITSETSGNIIDTKLSNFRIFGGLFNPTLTNSEVGDVVIHHKGVIHNANFERTYRSLSKSAKEFGNKQLAKDMKIAEFDFIREKKKGLAKGLMYLDKIYWGYGQNPRRLIIVTIITVFLFGLFYSLFPENFGNHILVGKPYYKVLFNTQYFSVVTFTTLGYGDMSTIGFLKLFSALEALFGAITLGFLVSGLTRNE